MTNTINNPAIIDDNTRRSSIVIAANEVSEVDGKIAPIVSLVPWHSNVDILQWLQDRRSVMWGQLHLDSSNDTFWLCHNHVKSS